jgi:hypothetical protein
MQHFLSGTAFRPAASRKLALNLLYTKNKCEKKAEPEKRKQ